MGERWGGTPHNKGVYIVDQKGQPKGWKKCRCCGLSKTADDFYSGSGYLNRRAVCKECENKMRVARGFAEDVREPEDFYVVKFDPTGIFDRGARFPGWDFMESLRGNVWPVGMILEKEPEQVLLVIVTKLATIEDAYSNQEDNDDDQT